MEGGSQLGKTVNVTHDVSLMVLKITLLSIFGDDYETAAPHLSSSPKKRHETLTLLRRWAP